MHANTGLYESDGITFTTESSSSHLAGTFWSLGYIGGYHLANNGTAAGYAGGLVFKTKPANSTANYNLTTTMVLDAAGNLGIGQTNPTYKLDVNGTGRFTGDLTVGGNITVNGTTTTVSTTNMVVSDSLIELNNGASSNANDCGIVIERGSTGDNAFMGWDESADKFLMGTTTATGASTGNLSVTTGTLVANLEGNVTGNLTGNVTGSILTAAQTNITSVGTLSSLNVSGSVGIGTTSPSTKLEIDGSTSDGKIKITENIKLAGPFTSAG